MLYGAHLLGICRLGLRGQDPSSKLCGEAVAFDVLSTLSTETQAFIIVRVRIRYQPVA